MFFISTYLASKPANWNSPKGNVFSCPSNPVVQSVSASRVSEVLAVWGLNMQTTYGLSPSPANAGRYAWQCSYCINDAVVGEQDLGSAKLAAWQRPAEEYLIMETCGSGTSAGDTDIDSNDVAVSDNSLFMKHSEGMNLAYIDGHVKWLRDSRVVTDGVANNGKGKPVYYADEALSFHPWRPRYLPGQN